MTAKITATVSAIKASERLCHRSFGDHQPDTCVHRGQSVSSFWLWYFQHGGIGFGRQRYVIRFPFDFKGRFDVIEDPRAPFGDDKYSSASLFLIVLAFGSTLETTSSRCF